MKTVVVTSEEYTQIGNGKEQLDDRAAFGPSDIEKFRTSPTCCTKIDVESAQVVNRLMRGAPQTNVLPEAIYPECGNIYN